MADKKVNPGLVWTVSIVIALLFGSLGILVILRPERFAEDPMPDAVRIGLGAVFCLGAGLLLIPRVTWVGALLLATTLVGVSGVSAYHHQFQQTVIPLMFTVSLGTLAYIRRPGAQGSASPTIPPPPPTP